MSEFKLTTDMIASHVRSVPRSGIRDFFDIVSQMPDILSLGIGEPDFDTPWHIREHAIREIERGNTHYTSNLGLPELRLKIAAYVEETFGFEVDCEREVLITVGVSEALDLAVRALINPGDEVLYHEPCYVSYAPMITMAHGTPVPVATSPEDNFRLTREHLEEKVTQKTKLLMLNFPNNPTGAVIERSDVEDIAEFAREHNLLVITDEIYSELTFEGEHVSIASLPGMKERTIFLHGMSKALAMTGFRIGYAVAPEILTEAMMKIHQYSMLCAPVLSQVAAIESLRDPWSDIEPMRAEYDRRRRFLLKSFAEMELDCVRPNGAFYAFPSITSTGMTSYDFAMQLIEDQKVAVVPGTAFGPCGEGFVRCSYATSMEKLEEAMDRIGTFLKKIRG